MLEGQTCSLRRAFTNSRLIEYLYARLSPQIRGGFYRFIAQYMEQLPIVEPAAADQVRLATLVDQLQALGKQEPQTDALGREADAIIYLVNALRSEQLLPSNMSSCPHM